MKQRQRCRTSYDFHSASPVQKESFASAISTTLPNASSFPRITPLNQLWHQFKLSLLSASRSCFPRPVTFLDDITKKGKYFTVATSMVKIFC
ncbi:hypothetical protein RhiirA4_492717 [Rhizophagus irregularis]|uniref:Uncharacterized protein n=1 Tax=Rhizophagus irregularis TaxID=588596 RepID=A0A2I1HXA1_9GLOM|nr:hypothetical protein RhiirA4_492717 [Rhizophagus irregularis]